MGWASGQDEYHIIVRSPSMQEPLKRLVELTGDTQQTGSPHANEEPQTPKIGGDYLPEGPLPLRRISNICEDDEERRSEW